MSSDRLKELLVQQAIEALSATEKRELDALLDDEPTADVIAFEFAAAALHLSVLPTDEPLPASLRAAVESDAAAYFAAKQPNTGND